MNNREKIKRSELIGSVIGAVSLGTIGCFGGYFMGENVNDFLGISNIYARGAIDLVEINLASLFLGTIGMGIGAGFAYGISELAKTGDKMARLEELIRDHFKP